MLDSPPTTGHQQGLMTGKLHSPLSPLSPSSPVFPDGLLTPYWITKHQTLVPSVFLAFFTLMSDPNLSSLHDNILKNEISQLKAALNESGYKIRLAVVLVADDAQALHNVAHIDDRVANIRRATGLD